MLEEDARRVGELLQHPDIEALKGVAIHLHDEKCKHEHTEACGWFYENGADYKAAGRSKGTWYGWAHSRWLIKAADVCTANELTPKLLLEFLETYDKIMKSMKP